MRVISVIMLCMMLSSCKTTATQYKRIGGEMVEVERLELKGIKMSKEAKFSDKAEIGDKSGLSGILPTIKIDMDDILKD